MKQAELGVVQRMRKQAELRVVKKVRKQAELGLREGKGANSVR